MHRSICAAQPGAARSQAAASPPTAAQRAAQPGAPPPPPLLPPHLGLRAASACLAALVCIAAPPLVLPPPPAAAAIPLSTLSDDAQRARALGQLGGRYVRAPLPSRREPEEEPTAVRIQRLQEMMAAGRAAADAGRYDDALRSFDAVVQQFPDFATTEYSRLARALTLYQLGRTSDAILALEDLEVSLRGYAEVHAALASILYVERPALLDFAEQQWEIAMEFNRNFADREWVLASKHWPPRMMAALDRFLTLSG